MNSRDDRKDEFGDARVAGEYRASSDERTPAELDRRILAAARHAIDSDAGKRNAWLRPLAFAATLVLAVALLFEMQPELDPAVPESLNGMAPLSDRPATRPTAQGTPDGGARGRQREQQRGAPEPVTATPEPTAVQGRSANPRKPASRPPQAAAPKPEAQRPAAGRPDSGLDLEKPTLKRVERPPAAVTAPHGKLLQSPDSSLPTVEEHCAAEQVVEADAWWHCIEELRDAGASAAAEAELNRLRERFPDFRPEP